MKHKPSLKNNLPYTLLRLDTAYNANCLFCNVPQESFPSLKMTLADVKKWLVLQTAGKNLCA